MDLGPIDDIVIDGFGEGIGFLKNHADLGPQRHHIDIFTVNIDAELARQIIKADYEIDEMEVDIEEECLKVISLH